MASGSRGCPTARRDRRRRATPRLSERPAGTSLSEPKRSCGRTRGPSRTAPRSRPPPVSTPSGVGPPRALPDLHSFRAGLPRGCRVAEIGESHRRVPEGVLPAALALRDVGTNTETPQHGLLLSFRRTGIVRPVRPNLVFSLPPEIAPSHAATPEGVWRAQS